MKSIRHEAYFNELKTIFGFIKYKNYCSGTSFFKAQNRTSSLYETQSPTNKSELH